MDDHVGGLAILRNPGKDNTEKFFGPQHPPSVSDAIETFLIGYVKEKDDKEPQKLEKKDDK